MTDHEDKDMLAAEYVLGTLDARQRDAVNARRGNEPDLEVAIIAWENRLSPLNTHYEAVAPSSNLFANIRSRIDAEGIEIARTVPGIADFAALKRKLAIWRVGALGSAAIAAGLLITVFTSDPVLPVADGKFVAVFHRDDTQPAFVMSVDLDTREVTIRPVEATVPEGKTYQLWIVTDETGPQPQSLGLLENVANPTTKQLGQFAPAMLRKATFGISLEPVGGSPTGLPTGPAIHGHLIPVVH
ncbi:anti-sigma factor [Thalassospira sp. SM2505]